MPTLTGGAAAEITATHRSALLWLVEVTPQTSGAPTYYWSDREHTHGGQAYEARIVGDPRLGGGGLEPGAVVTGRRTASFGVSDLDHSISQAPDGAGTTGYWQGATVVIRMAFEATGEDARAFSFVCTGISTEGGVTTFSCVDLFRYQTADAIPSGRFDRATFPALPEASVGKTIPVVYGRKMVPLTLVDEGDAAGPKFAIGYGTYTVHALYQRGLARTAYTTSTSGGITFIHYTSGAIKDAAGNVVEHWADVTRTDGVNTYSANRNNPANVLADLWTNATYGLGRSAALLDTTTFTAAASAYDAASQGFHCVLMQPVAFGPLLQNLLTSCAARARVNDKIYLYRRGQEPAAPVTISDANIVARNETPQIRIADADLTHIYNERTLLYADAGKWSVKGPAIEEASYTDTASQTAVGRRMAAPFRSFFVGDFALADWAIYHAVDLQANALIQVTVTLDAAGLQLDEGETVYLDWPQRWPSGAQQLVITAVRREGRYTTITGVTPGNDAYSANSPPSDSTPTPADTFNLTGKALLGDTGVEGAIRSSSSKTYADNSVGMFLGRDASGEVQFEIYSDANQYLRWDSTSGLVLKGSANITIVDGQITTPTITSPVIDGTTGRFSGTVYVGTTASGIKIIGSSGDIQSNGFVAGTSGWRIRQNGDVEFNAGTFRGDVIISGTDGEVDINTSANVPNIEVKNSNGSILLVAPGLISGMSFSYPYCVQIEGVDETSSSSFSPDSALKVKQGTASKAIYITGSDGEVDIVGSSLGIVYAYSLAAQPAIRGDASSGYTGVYGYSGTGTGSYGVYGQARIGLRGRSSVAGGASCELKKLSSDSPHFKCGDAIRTSDPNGVVTGDFGDVMVWWFSSGPRPVMSVCWGDGTGPGSSGKNWYALN